MSPKDPSGTIPAPPLPKSIRGVASDTRNSTKQTHEALEAASKYEGKLISFALSIQRDCAARVSPTKAGHRPRAPGRAANSAYSRTGLRKRILDMLEFYSALRIPPSLRLRSLNTILDDPPWHIFRPDSTAEYLLALILTTRNPTWGTKRLAEEINARMTKRFGRKGNVNREVVRRWTHNVRWKESVELLKSGREPDSWLSIVALGIWYEVSSLPAKEARSKSTPPT